MSKVNIKIMSLGHLPADVNLEKIKEWKSNIFKLSNEIEHFGLRTDSDGKYWGFSDLNISEQLPDKQNEDFSITIVGVPLENNWYTRRVEENKVVFTFHEISNFLRQKNIPLENIILRVIYAYTLIYLRNGNRIPSVHELTNFTHDETRGCIFDMNGLKEDIVFSCDRPIICTDCSERLIREKVSETVIKQAKSELINIKKDLFYQIADKVKKHPIWTIILSSLWAIVIGSIVNLLTRYI